MTSLPANPSATRLGLVIDLDTCVGCQACVVSCKEWNTGGYPAPLSDTDPYGAHPSGAWLNRVHGYEVDDGNGLAHHPFPALLPALRHARLRHRVPHRRLLQARRGRHRAGRRGLCIGCGLCAWACPYGARELDVVGGVMKKCTLCVDRIYNENLPVEEREPACVAACPVHARHFGDLGDPASPVSRLVAERQGYDLMPEFGYQPTNKYLPPRPRRQHVRTPRPSSRPPTPKAASSAGSTTPVAAVMEPTHRSSPRKRGPRGRLAPASPHSLAGLDPSIHGQPHARGSSRQARGRQNQGRVTPCTPPPPSSASPWRPAPATGCWRSPSPPRSSAHCPTTGSSPSS
jgi:sulfite dehydrogenase (quinone) subunit SoeB